MFPTDTPRLHQIQCFSRRIYLIALIQLENMFFLEFFYNVDQTTTTAYFKCQKQTKSGVVFGLFH